MLSTTTQFHTGIPGNYNTMLYPAWESHALWRKSVSALTESTLSLQLFAVRMAGLMGMPFTETPEKLLGASLEMNERLNRDYQKPSFNLSKTTVDGQSVEVREVTVLTKPFGSLLHFDRQCRRSDPKLLVVAPMSGHFATLLRETVQHLLPNHDVYITDWHDARSVDLSEGAFGLDDYIDYLKGFLQFMGPDTHLLAVCQPSVPALAAVASLEKEKAEHQPLSLTLMAGPVDPSAAPTAVTEFAKDKSLGWFERRVLGKVPHRYPGAGRLVYPGFMQLQSFIAMNPSNHLRSHLRLFGDLVLGEEASANKTKAFYDEYLSVCDLPAKFYLDTIDRVFLRNTMGRDEFEFRGEPLSLEAISQTALLTIEGEKDDISAPGQTFAAHRLCPNIPSHKRFHHLQTGAGHYGVFSGRRWRNEIAPRITGFVRHVSEQEGHQHAEASKQALPEALS